MERPLDRGVWRGLLPSHIGNPPLSNFLNPPVQRMLLRYRDNFNERFLKMKVPKRTFKAPEFKWKSNLDKIRQGKWRDISKFEFTYDLLRADPGRFLFSPVLWVFFGSLLGGPTSAIVFGFVSRFVIQPFYDGLLANFETYVHRQGESLPYSEFPFGLYGVDPASTLTDIQRAYDEILSLRLVSEDVHAVTRLYLLEKILARTSSQSFWLQRVQEIRRQVLLDTKNADADHLWDIISTLAKRQGVSLHDPGMFLILHVAGLSIRPPSLRWPSIGLLLRTHRREEIPDVLRERLRRAKPWIKRGLVRLALDPIRAGLRRLHLYQSDNVLFNLENRILTALGTAPKIHPKESLWPRSATQTEPWLASVGDVQRKKDLLNYLGEFGLPEIEPLIQTLDKLEIKYEDFVDDDWYPARLQFVSYAKPHRNEMYSFPRYQLDLENGT